MHNRALVEEVIEFAKSGGLLAGQPGFSSPDVVFVADMDEALERAHSQWLFLPDGEMDSDHSDWAGIREDESGKVGATLIDAPDKWERTEASKPFEKEAYRTGYAAVEDEYEEAAEDVGADMGLIAEARAHMGTENAFFERLFALYREGVWPCGWAGNYPEGKFRVFNPTP